MMDDNSNDEMIDEVLMNWLEENAINTDSESDFMFSSDSDLLSSDSDGDERQRVCIKNFVEETAPNYSDNEYQKHFRLKKQTINNLIGQFRRTNFLNSIEYQRDEQITHDRAFLLTIWYLANTETFRQIADRFDLSLSTAHRVLDKTLDFICSLQETYIKWPFLDEEKKAISIKFERYPLRTDGIIGAIDGCHIRIRKPVEFQRDYYNRKKFHSVILQGIVNDKKMFTDVFIGEPGSMNDARVLRRSPVYDWAMNDINFLGNYFLIGDSGYPNLPWLVSPFRDNGHLSRAQNTFNYRLSATRIKVEHAFGLLKQRFRRLLMFNNLRLDVIVRCIMAACILHNICILENENSDDENLDNYRVNIVRCNDRRAQIFNQMFPRENMNVSRQ